MDRCLKTLNILPFSATKDGRSEGFPQQFVWFSVSLELLNLRCKTIDFGLDRSEPRVGSVDLFLDRRRGLFRRQ